MVSATDAFLMPTERSCKAREGRTSGTDSDRILGACMHNTHTKQDIREVPQVERGPSPPHDLQAKAIPPQKDRLRIRYLVNTTHTVGSMKGS